MAESLAPAGLLSGHFWRVQSDQKGVLPGNEVEDCSPEKIVKLVGEKLELFGLDVVAPLALSWYNDALPEGLHAAIPATGATGGAAFTLLVGNTKHVWEPFLGALRAHPQLLELPHPLDAYMERSVEAVLQDALPGLSCRVYYGHRQCADVGPAGGAGAHVALQRMAQAAGLAYLDQESHLCMHPKYGPWFALRAALVFDSVRHDGVRPPQLPSPLNHTTRQYISLAVRSATRVSSDDLSGCASSGDMGAVHDTKQSQSQSQSQPPAVGSPADLIPSGAIPEVMHCHLRHLQHQQQRPQRPPASGTATASAPASASASVASATITAAAPTTAPAIELRTPSSSSHPPDAVSIDGGSGSEGGGGVAPSQQAAAVSQLGAPSLEVVAGQALRQAGFRSVPPATRGGPVHHVAAQSGEQAGTPGERPCSRDGGTPNPAGLSGQLPSPQTGQGAAVAARMQQDGAAAPLPRAPTGCAVRAQWQKWVAIRDAPCSGHPWRYPKHQLTYHYTGDRDLLRRLVQAADLSPHAPERLAVELELPTDGGARRRSRERPRSASFAGDGALPAGHFAGCAAAAGWPSAAAASAAAHAAADAASHSGYHLPAAAVNGTSGGTGPGVDYCGVGGIGHQSGGLVSRGYPTGSGVHPTANSFPGAGGTPGSRRSMEAKLQFGAATAVGSDGGGTGAMCIAPRTSGAFIPPAEHSPQGHSPQGSSPLLLGGRVPGLASVSSVASSPSSAAPFEFEGRNAFGGTPPQFEGRNTFGGRSASHSPQRRPPGSYPAGASPASPTGFTPGGFTTIQYVGSPARHYSSPARHVSGGGYASGTNGTGKYQWLTGSPIRGDGTPTGVLRRLNGSPVKRADMVTGEPFAAANAGSTDADDSGDSGLSCQTAGGCQTAGLTTASSGGSGGLTSPHAAGTPSRHRTDSQLREHSPQSSDDDEPHTHPMRLKYETIVAGGTVGRTAGSVNDAVHGTR